MSLQPLRKHYIVSWDIKFTNQYISTKLTKYTVLEKRCYMYIVITVHITSLNNDHFLNRWIYVAVGSS